MNKTDLVKYVSDKLLITEQDALIIIDVFLKGIKKGLSDGERVKIREFGSFFLQKRIARVAVNPRSREEINIPAKTVVKFNPSDKLYSKE